MSATTTDGDGRETSWINVRDGQLAEGWDTWNLGGLVETLRSAAS